MQVRSASSVIAFPFILYLRWHSRQAERALAVVRNTSTPRVYKSSINPRVRCRTLTISRDDRAAPAGSSTMERSLSAPGGDITCRHQGLERPVPSNRRRTHTAFSISSLHRYTSLINVSSGNIVTLTWFNYRLHLHTPQSESYFRQSIHPLVSARPSWRNRKGFPRRWAVLP